MAILEDNVLIEVETHEVQLALQVKPFGKDGVRLCWTRSKDLDSVLVAEAKLGQDWVVISKDKVEDESGTIVIRALSQAGVCPRSVLWRLRCDVLTSDCQALTRVFGENRSRQGTSAQSVQLSDHEIERVFNILQWYGTIVVDMREGDYPRLAESLVCPDLAALAKIPFRDDAVVIGNASSTFVSVLYGRVSRVIYIVSENLLAAMVNEYCFLFGDPSSQRQVLPNIVDGHLVVGHQGHALRLAEWAETLGIVGVINLAPNKVPSTYSAIGMRERYLDVRHKDGEPLWDTAGDGGRLLDILPMVLESIEAALSTRTQGRVFIHCQQGRSRAASITVAYLLTRHCNWTLFDAVSFLALRRPEVELNDDYAEALEVFASSLGRQASLPKIREHLPRALRGGGVARDVRDKCFDRTLPDPIHVGQD